MKTLGWSRLDTVVIVSMAIMIPAFAYAKVENGAKPLVAGIHSDIAALHSVETSRSLAADPATRLRLSGVSLALR